MLRTWAAGEPADDDDVLGQLPSATLSRPDAKPTAAVLALAVYVVRDPQVRKHVRRDAEVFFRSDWLKSWTYRLGLDPDAVSERALRTPRDHATRPVARAVIARLWYDPARYQPDHVSGARPEEEE